MGQGPRKINAKALAKDIKSGSSSEFLTNKYQVSPKGLQRLFSQMLQHRLITDQDLAKLAIQTRAEPQPKSPPSEPRAGTDHGASQYDKRSERRSRIEKTETVSVVADWLVLFLSASVGILTGYAIKEAFQLRWWWFTALAAFLGIVSLFVIPHMARRRLVSPAFLALATVLLLVIVKTDWRLTTACPELGQFLGGPGGFSDCFSGYGLLGIAAMLMVVSTARGYLGRVSAMIKKVFVVALVASCVVGLATTLILQSAGGYVFDTMSLVARGDLSRLGSSYYSSGLANNPYLTRGLAVAGSKALQNRTGRIVVVATLAIAFVVGAGYAYSVVDLPFFWHAVAFTVGVGIVEELAKALAGLVIVLGVTDFCRTHSSECGDIESDDAQKRRLIIASFAVAGLGFGSGEAIHYFGLYRHLGSDVWTYLLRSSWCVKRHGAFPTIVGVGVSRLYFDKLPSRLPDAIGYVLSERPFVVFCMVFPVVSHGLYDAFAVHRNDMQWALGSLVMITAYLMISRAGRESQLQTAS